MRKKIAPMAFSTAARTKSDIERVARLRNQSLLP